MLAKVARQVLNLAPQRPEEPVSRVVRIEPGLAEVASERFAGIDELELAHQPRQPIDVGFGQLQHLADLARRAAAPIRDHVGGHRRSQRAVAFVHVLNDALALVATRQIQVDVRPLAALLREEPLEEQPHPHRIDGRDAERVADGAVGRRAAPLHEDALLPAEIDDVPDDEEVAGEIETVDEIQLTRDLRAGAIVERPVAIARADVRQPSKERRLGLPGRNRVLRKAVAEIGQREIEPLGQRLGAGERLRQIREHARHELRRLQIPLGVGRQPPARPASVVLCRMHVRTS